MSFEIYNENCLKRGLSPVTIETNTRYFEMFKSFLRKINFEGTELDVTYKEIQAYSKWVNEQGFKSNSIRGRLQPFLPFYREAVKHGWMLENPAEIIKLPRKEETIPNILSITEVKKVLEFPDLSKPLGIRDRMLMELCYSTAIRACEASKLKVDDFSDDFTRVRFIGKGDKEAVLPVGRMAAHFLRFYVNEIWKPLAVCDKLIISLRSGEEIKLYGLKNRLKQIGEQYGLKFTLSAHVFRYSIATHLSDEGVDVRLIQEFLRHECINTTARYINYGIGELKGIHSQTHPQEAQ